ncbi:MAG: hypothetical protein IJJ41_10135, partial [Clostridia bacterium]|nr:hypothetical protein [Clostridia bacterium]
YPELADYSYTRLSGENNYYPAPEHAVLTAPYVFGKDQYGAQLAGTVTSSFVCLGEKYYDGSAWQNASFGEPSYAFNNQTAELTPLKANGYQYHLFDIRPQTEWVIGGQYINVNGATNGMYYGNTKTALMDYTPQTVIWQYYTDNSAGNTGTLQQPTTTVLYGDTPAARTDLPTAYYDSTSHHSGGYFTTAPVTEATTYTMQYTTNGEHTLAYGELESTDAEYHSKHLATCTAGCGYTNKVDHTYSATSFNFANDGKSADVSRQCTVNGCKHIQSGTVTLGDGITSTVKTPATCLTVGTTTYTATSPFGDGKTATKDVDDIAALDHDWTATRFVFAADGKTATAYRDCQRDASHNQSQGAVVTSEKIVDETCTTPGTTRYTATSPFGDGATDTVDKQDVPAMGHNTTGQGWQKDATYHWKNCINGCGTPQDKAEHTWGAWSDNGDGTHSRTCTTCSYKATASHDTYTTETTAPTCTAQGYTTYTCPTCNYSYVENYTTALGHDASGSYQSDGSNHWKVCQRAGCGVDIYEESQNVWTAGRIGHTWNAGTVTTQPTCTEPGVLTKTCTVCGNDSNTSPVASLGHNYTEDSKRDADTLKTAATCTTDGEYYYTCSRCNDISDTYYYTAAEGTVGYRTGHDFELNEVQPGDGTSGYVYFHCKNSCGLYYASTYNTAKQKYEVNETQAYPNVADTQAQSDSAPSPHFNNFSATESDEGYKLDYYTRPASFKLESDSYESIEKTRQYIRFAGSVDVPDGVSYRVNDTSEPDRVVDFGYIYTQYGYSGIADYDATQLTLEKAASDSKVAVMSVAAQNSGIFDSDWKGVSLHTRGEGSSTTYSFTFNLLLNLKAKNWTKMYVARPYITYIYHGVTYTVYDGGDTATSTQFSHCSVYYLADWFVTYYIDPSTGLPYPGYEKIVDYCNTRITSHYADYPEGDWTEQEQHGVIDRQDEDPLLNF